MIFTIFQVSRDRERWLTASVRHFTLCSILLERYFLATVIVLQLHMWETTVQHGFRSRRNVTGFAVKLAVTYSETDSVKCDDASVYRHTIFLWLKTETLQNNKP